MSISQNPEPSIYPAPFPQATKVHIFSGKKNPSHFKQVWVRPFTLLTYSCYFRDINQTRRRTEIFTLCRRPRVSHDLLAKSSAFVSGACAVYLIIWWYISLITGYLTSFPLSLCKIQQLNDVQCNSIEYWGVKGRQQEVQRPSPFRDIQALCSCAHFPAITLTLGVQTLLEINRCWLCQCLIETVQYD